MTNGSCSKKQTPSSPKMMFDVSSVDFSSMLICALRYSLGRMTYMPHTVTSFIRPLLPYLDNKTLYVMIRDIESSHSYGDETIDKPMWLKFLADCKTEYNSRKEETDGFSI